MKRIKRKVSEATKRKMSLAKMGSKNPNFQKKVSDETKKKISEAMKKYWEGIPE